MGNTSDKDLQYEEYEDLGYVTLTFEDGSEGDFEVLAIYPVGENQYTALRPMGSKGLDEVYIYRYTDNGEDEEPAISDITDDDEFDFASDAFDELLEEDLYGDDE